MIRVEYLGMAFAASEILLGLRRRAAKKKSVSRDSGTLALAWIVIGAAAGASFWIARTVDFGRMQLGAAGRVAALALLFGGIALRWWAILVLGRYFTVDVAIHDDHRLVTRGPYRVLRHPSYTGLLLAFLGFGLTFGSWPALAALVLPVGFAFARRMQVEERALAERFGAEWSAHCARTWRLVPFVW